ncbi:retrovirus-related Pol polyprotein from transposon opus [Elysia marginata]|uniref:Retrovirus-related Pol polyprotein from transposon opus n=1 Tax=Elysia marginata TaxID=1093978 RepID=A0AAV4IGZ0_9GAST|nr:retrovirus-related Pol polyprotein from transposon opus [Elysia marginata]
MASIGLTKKTQGHCIVPLFYKDRHYTQKLSLLPDLCADVILGHDFLGIQESVSLLTDPKTLSIFLAAANIEAPSLFENLTEDCKPIATKSRRHSLLDERFIESEVQKLLKEEIIEPSLLPWRAQVLVTSGERHKKRLVIDYSQTINKYTLLDAYPLPRLDKMAETISRYKYYSTFDLKSAYHQILLKESDKEYTAFEACDGRESTVSLRHLAPVGNERQFEPAPGGTLDNAQAPDLPLDSGAKSTPEPDVVTLPDQTTEATDLEADDSPGPLSLPETLLPPEPTANPVKTPFVRTSRYNLRSGRK